mmetsp:Transcript_24568/g.43101  ORF Transcript_24568/g.43101 Transcript_24568/m.43101 type:complete len:710 (+) Transcript_24568:195-2324(+)
MTLDSGNAASVGRHGGHSSSSRSSSKDRRIKSPTGNLNKNHNIHNKQNHREKIRHTRSKENNTDGRGGGAGDKGSTTSGTTGSSNKRRPENSKAHRTEHYHSTDDEEYEDSVSIYVTNTAHDRMRKVSALTIDDSEFSESRPTISGKEDRGTRPGSRQARKKGMPVVLETRTRSIAIDKEIMESPVFTRKKSDDGGDHRGQGMSSPRPTTAKNSKASYVKSPLRASKSSDFVPPAALQTVESPRNRAHSLDDNQCLVEVEEIVLPPGGNSASRDAKLQDGNDSSDDSYKAVQIVRKGMEVRGYVAPSTKQKQLMRKVSGLGMEDPVFGKIADQLKPTHASNIFDDMDLADVPEDMKDMVSLASDRTDEVEMDDDILDSPLANRKSKQTSHGHNFCSLRGIPSVQQYSSLPPLGLDPEAMVENKKAPRSNVEGSFQAPPPPPAPPVEIARFAKSTKKSHYEAPPPPNFTPPTGGFRMRKSTRKTQRRSNATSISDDPHLAAQVDAMFQNSMTSLNLSTSNHELSEESLHSQGGKSRQRGARPIPKGHSSVGTSFSPEVYVPPGAAPMERNREEPAAIEAHRALPSMDALFPHSGPVGCAPPMKPEKSPHLRKWKGVEGFAASNKKHTVSSDVRSPSSKPVPGGSVKSKPRKLTKAEPNSPNSNNNKPKTKRRGTASTTDLSPTTTAGADSTSNSEENWLPGKPATPVTSR